MGVPCVHALGGDRMYRMYMASFNPPALLGAPKNYLSVTKIAQKVRFLVKFQSSSKIRKSFLKNLKYFLGYGPIFEKKVCKKSVKKGSK